MKTWCRSIAIVCGMLLLTAPVSADLNRQLFWNPSPDGVNLYRDP